MKLVITINSSDGLDASKLDNQKLKIVDLVQGYVEENLIDDEILEGDAEYDMDEFVSWDTM